jgi:hypothetical protein
MIDKHLLEAERNLEDLSNQVGKPAVERMPQTTNQGIVVVLQDLLAAVKMLRIKSQS